MYVIYHDPIKQSLKYNEKMKQFQQISVHECELTKRPLLCQDMIFHIITSTTCNDIQKQPFVYVDKKGNRRNLGPKNHKGKIILYQTEKTMIYGTKYHLKIQKLAKYKISISVS